MLVKTETTSPDKSVPQMPGLERPSWNSQDATEPIREVCAYHEPSSVSTMSQPRNVITVVMMPVLGPPGCSPSWIFRERLYPFRAVEITHSNFGNSIADNRREGNRSHRVFGSLLAGLPHC